MSAEPWSDQTPARNASRRVWGMAHASAAYAAAGDGDALDSLADSMAILGRRTGHERDRILHNYTRGLLLALQGSGDAAVPFLRRAIVSASASYPPPKLALARTLIEVGRPAEAIPVVQAALRGPVAGPGFYVTRTELHEVLGQAWDAAGNADSATAHYRQVVRAWENADRPFHARRAAVRRRLAELERSVSR
jgi:predicted Zn-dependent protease